MNLNWRGELKKQRRLHFSPSLMAVVFSLVTATSIVFAKDAKLSSDKQSQIESAIAKFMSALSAEELGLVGELCRKLGEQT